MSREAESGNTTLGFTPPEERPLEMEPVSAVGLASSIITFVEFAFKLVTGALEVYRSVDGTLEENARLERVIGDLNSIVDDLGKKGGGGCRSERAIRDLAVECQADAELLVDILKSLKVPGRRTLWKSVTAQWKALLRKDEITGLKERLQEYRSEIMLNLMLLLREDWSNASHIADRIGDDFGNLRNELERVKEDVVKEILAYSTPPAPANKDEESLENISKMLRELHVSARAIPVKQRILRQLVFNEMRWRREQIYVADDTTCGWVFKDYDASRNDEGNDGPADSRTGSKGRSGKGPESRHEEASMKIRSWLRHDHHILHLSGKAGSGKSTLMRYIARHKATQEDLKQWAGQKTLVTADFYFWNSGSDLQRSLQGLYRSLLFEVLYAAPELIAEVFPRQWNRFQAEVGDRRVESVDFGEEQIRDAFEILMNRTGEASGCRFCFFIDGLDEYHGDMMAHEELALKLRQWTKGRGVKILTSARPQQEYSGILEFTSNTIHLHTINRPDIKAYCKSRFANDRVASNTGDTYEEIISKISSYAEGVFLWACLVVNKLLEAIRQGDPHWVLQKKLDETPRELNKLYTDLRNSIASPIDRVRCDRMLLLAAKNPTSEELSALSFSWLDEGELQNPDFLSDMLREPYSPREMYQRVSRVNKLIGSLTKGLLEYSPKTFLTIAEQKQYEVLQTHNVAFFHRTVKEYLLESEDRMRELEASYPEFRKAAVYGIIFLADYVFDPERRSDARGHHSSLSRVISRLNRLGTDAFPFLEKLRAMLDTAPTNKRQNNHALQGCREKCRADGQLDQVANDDLSLLISTLSQTNGAWDEDMLNTTTWLHEDNLNKPFLVYWILSDDEDTIREGFRIPVFLVAMMFILVYHSNWYEWVEVPGPNKPLFKETKILSLFNRLREHARKTGQSALSSLRKSDKVVADMLGHYEHRAWTLFGVCSLEGRLPALPFLLLSLTMTRTFEWELASLLKPKDPTKAVTFDLIVLNQPLKDTPTLRALWEGANVRVAADGGANRVYELGKEAERKGEENIFVRVFPGRPLRPPSSLCSFYSDRKAKQDSLSVIIGDLDSLNEDSRAHFSPTTQIIHDEDQESTDFGKAIAWCRRATAAAPAEQPVDILALGGVGGRVDQGLSQLHHLFLFQPGSGYDEGRIYLLSEECVTILLKPGRHILRVREKSEGEGGGGGGGGQGEVFGKHVGILPIKEPSVITTRGLEWDVEDWPTSFGGRVSTSNHVRPEVDTVEVETLKEVLFTIALKDTQA
ncbi:hypothetical protein SAPIO_CDS1557 [Scedosporium apiospermum]|uniref:Thiamin pyrophosphokinase thiamin-binding domain-containing protein n=1 Tax=Pseudallescheria apiosperma TaxID=563466 RepID=A0A084GEJ5_PSEDA|nr:uncharacterized protein SAPIO_CDS1557 [Scedosporium apiospermum]KEZ45757.1 hypothetical protein SAPIO_CDS1557 [Scedosporium apiospermum]